MIRSYLTVFIILMLTVSQAYSQGTSIGTRQGVGLSQLFATGNGFSRDFFINQEFNTGYVGGIIIQQMANRTVGFQGGALYANKGWSQILGENGQVYTNDLNYLELEGLTHLQFGKGNFKFFIQGGIFGGYVLSSSDNFEEIADPATIRYRYDPDSDNKLNFGLKGGGGFSLDTNAGTFQANVLFGQALGNLIDTSDTTRALFTQVQTIEVGITYLLLLN